MRRRVTRRLDKRAANEAKLPPSEIQQHAEAAAWLILAFYQRPAAMRSQLFTAIFNSNQQVRQNNGTYQYRTEHAGKS